MSAAAGSDAGLAAGRLGQALPPLLLAAERLAATVAAGEHGRRRAGPGEAFWQYRLALPGDPARSIDWRRSARGDAAYVREREWQAVQTLMLWVDRGRSMGYSGDPRARPDKGARARLIAVALGLLALRAGERVGIAGDAAAPPRGGRAQGFALAFGLGGGERSEDAAEAQPEHGAPPPAEALVTHGAGFIASDFMGDPAPFEALLAGAAARGVRGVALQVIDPDEAGFPFDGRTLFESMGGALSHETDAAGPLRPRYLRRLAARQDAIAAAAARAGWHFAVHRSDEPAEPVLLWAHRALGEAR